MTTERPRVSVIIPAWNAGHCLADCLDSVAAQTLPSWEAIVVDDGSEDDTAVVAARYASARVRYFRQENQGQGAARNRGLDEARGEFIAFLDADDYWEKEFLERTVAFLDRHSEAVAVSTAFAILRVDGKRKVGPACAGDMKKFGDGIMLTDFFDFWAKHDHIRTGTALIRRTIVQAAGHQRADLRISQDLEYWGYIATFGDWGFIPEPLWVGTSRVAASRSGIWIGKYRARRRLCPTVESWEARIAPRLRSTDRAGFETVRGRVAAGFAHNLILAGVTERAYQVMAVYGRTMPSSRLVRVLRAGAALGRRAWPAVCGIVRMKEQAKAVRIGLLARSRKA